MPIYEYYCPDNHTVYQFYAKTLAQGQTIPRCPDNPKYRMQKALSAFAITGGGKKEEAMDGHTVSADPGEDAKLDAAMGAMEKEFANVDENDPKAMARMMRKMSEMTGEKIDGEMEEVVRKLEEGADPEALEEKFGGDEAGEPESYGEGPGEAPAADGPAKEKKHRFKARQTAPRRDPRLYDYE